MVSDLLARRPPLAKALELLSATGDSYVLEALFASMASDSYLTRQAEQIGLPMAEARGHDYAARDLLGMIPDRINAENFGSEVGEQLSERPEGVPIKLGLMVTSMLHSSHDLHSTLTERNQLPV